jgi:hypothetical protein
LVDGGIVAYPPAHKRSGIGIVNTAKEPLRIERASLEELPSQERVAILAEQADQIVLGFGTDFVLEEFGSREVIEDQKKKLIADLSLLLPDHSVFNSGSKVDAPLARSANERKRQVGQIIRGVSHITLLRVISRSVVLANVDAIVEAARLFRVVATDLMERLARKLGAPTSQFSDDPMFWRIYGQQGRLDEQWDYFFHGYECGFRNRRTGQDVEVRLGFPGEFGALDPYFFAKFVRSTPEVETVANLFPDSFHDPCCALEILHEVGHLQIVTANDGRRGVYSHQANVIDGA